MSNPVYTYKCAGDAHGPHYHDRPGSINETPPERVTCPVCGRAAGRYYGSPPTAIYKGTGWTGARNNVRNWRK